MKNDWLNLGSRDAGYQTVLERLNASPYDELVEIDLFNDRCRNLWHVENKYYVPVLHGDWSELYHYCAEHMIHPDDRETYLAMMDPDTLRQRLEQSEIPGVLSEELRYRTVNGEWLWVGQVVVSGAQGSLPEGVIYTYMYDINVQKQRELGGTAVTGSTAIHRDDLTGLLLDRDFHALAQLKLPELSGKWCVMALDIENFKLFCDWHGQQTGRILLAQIGEILLRQEQETGGLAGYRGQDDFELLIPYDTERIKRLYEALQKLIARIHRIIFPSETVPPAPQVSQTAHSASPSSPAPKCRFVCSSALQSHRLNRLCRRHNFHKCRQDYGKQRKPLPHTP